MIDHDALRAKALALLGADCAHIPDDPECPMCDFRDVANPKTILALLDEIAALRADAERLDRIESCIRDGSYPSILNDIIAVCQHAYATFGTGPALRTAIDGSFAAIDRARGAT